MIAISSMTAPISTGFANARAPPGDRCRPWLPVRLARAPQARQVKRRLLVASLVGARIGVVCRLPVAARGRQKTQSQRAEAIAALVRAQVRVLCHVEVAASLGERAGIRGGGRVTVLVGAAVGLLGLLHIAALGVAIAELERTRVRGAAIHRRFPVVAARHRRSRLPSRGRVTRRERV